MVVSIFQKQLESNSFLVNSTEFVRTKVAAPLCRIFCLSVAEKSSTTFEQKKKFSALKKKLVGKLEMPQLPPFLHGRGNFSSVWKPSSTERPSVFDRLHCGNGRVTRLSARGRSRGVVPPRLVIVRGGRQFFFCGNESNLKRGIDLETEENNGLTQQVYFPRILSFL